MTTDSNARAPPFARQLSAPIPRPPTIPKDSPSPEILDAVPRPFPPPRRATASTPPDADLPKSPSLSPAQSMPQLPVTPLAMTLPRPTLLVTPPGTLRRPSTDSLAPTGVSIDPEGGETDLTGNQPQVEKAEKIAPSVKHGFNLLAGEHFSYVRQRRGRREEKEREQRARERRAVGFTPVARSSSEEIPPCSCGCTSFEADPFKPSKCTQCFHVHVAGTSLVRQPSNSTAAPKEDAPPCKSCRCVDFKADAFKPAKCSNCFHVHTA